MFFKINLNRKEISYKGHLGRTPNTKLFLSGFRINSMTFYRDQKTYVANYNVLT